MYIGRGTLCAAAAGDHKGEALAIGENLLSPD